MIFLRLHRLGPPRRWRKSATRPVYLSLGSNLSEPQASDVFTYSGLTGELLYYIAMRACDEAGNCSEFVCDDSMSAGYPPEAIDDLMVSEPNAPVNNLSTVVMSWSAPEDTGSGGSHSSCSELRFRLQPHAHYHGGPIQ